MQNDQTCVLERDPQQVDGQETTTPESEEAVYLCRVCNREHRDEVESEVESWIECDVCQQWFHFSYVNVSCDSIPKVFTCSYCC